MAWSSKRPEEDRNYGFDWSPRLSSGETIASADWVVEAPLVKMAQSFQGNTAIVRVSGGAHNGSYELTCTVVTSLDQTLVDSRRLLVQDR